jgi:hypothetical protein
MQELFRIYFTQKKEYLVLSRDLISTGGNFLKDRNNLLTLLRGCLKFQCFLHSGRHHDTGEHQSWQLTTHMPLLLRHKTKRLSIIVCPET